MFGHHRRPTHLLLPARSPLSQGRKFHGLRNNALHFQRLWDFGIGLEAAEGVLDEFEDVNECDLG